MLVTSFPVSNRSTDPTDQVSSRNLPVPLAARSLVEGWLDLFNRSGPVEAGPGVPGCEVVRPTRLGGSTHWVTTSPSVGCAWVCSSDHMLSTSAISIRLSEFLWITYDHLSLNPEKPRNLIETSADSEKCSKRCRQMNEVPSILKSEVKVATMRQGILRWEVWLDGVEVVLRVLGRSGFVLGASPPFTEEIAAKCHSRLLLQCSLSGRSGGSSWCRSSSILPVGSEVFDK